MVKSLETIDFHIESLKKQGKDIDNDLKEILYDLAYAGKRISRIIQRTGLEKLEGSLADQDLSNASGDDVKPLDIISNDIFRLIADRTGHYALLASEEEEGVYAPESGQNAKHLLAIDPLDGSSNLDVNVSVGSIFSVFKRKEGPLDQTQFFRKGSEQLLGGYIIYGNTMELVYTSGHGVFRFIYDAPLGEFLLAEQEMSYPNKLTCYSINESLTPKLSPVLKDYVNQLKERKVSARYVGSLVADFHRNLIKGGIYIYPAYTGVPNGKLRVLYEAYPLAFLSEQAGGGASNATKNILDIELTELHQRSPLYIGNESEIEAFKALENTLSKPTIS